jgi:hypothetical protein
MAMELAALHAALGLAKQPNLIDRARKTAFPTGITLLLEIAAGDMDTVEKCAAAANVAERQIRLAAEFYIEQVLLNEKSDSYRTLGGDRSASSSDLRRNMALLMRWLHPDAAAHNSDAVGLDRTVFAERVAAAWENLKTDDRRAAYDAQTKTMAASAEKVSLSTRPSLNKHSVSTKEKPRKKPSNTAPASSLHKSHKAKPRRLKIVPKLEESWITRMLQLLRRKR